MSRQYKELQKPAFPNRYASYLQCVRRYGADERTRTLPARKVLELPHILRHGRVPNEFLRDPALPSAPLRAFSYTQVGGSAACGKVGGINALFKCPDGYAGGYPRKVKRGVGPDKVPDGYADFEDEDHRCG